MFSGAAASQDAKTTIANTQFAKAGGETLTFPTASVRRSLRMTPPL